MRHWRRIKKVNSSIDFDAGYIYTEIIITLKGTIRRVKDSGQGSTFKNKADEIMVLR